MRAALAPYDRKLGLDAAVLSRSERVLHRALEGQPARTRAELASALEAGGVPLGEGQRLGHLMMHAELSGLLCSGPRRGKQFSYRLLDELVQEGPRYRRVEALTELTRRYLASHGPALALDS